MTDAVVMFEGTIYEKGYGWVAQKVMRDKDLKPQAKAIYAYICSMAGNPTDIDNRKAFPSVSIMKAELGIKSQDTFYKYMNALKDKGYLKVDQEKDEQGKFKRNIYKVVAVPQPVEEKEQTEQNPDTKGKKPQSKKSTTVRKSKKSTTAPQSKNRTTVNRKSENRNTNSNSLNRNSFNIDDDDINNSARANNISYPSQDKRLKPILNLDSLKEMRSEFILISAYLERENIFTDEQIAEVLQYLVDNGQNVEEVSKQDLDKAFKKVFVNGSETISSPMPYFAKCVVNEIVHRKVAMVQRKKIAERQQDMANRDTSVYYDWTQDDPEKDSLVSFAFSHDAKLQQAK